MPGLNNTLVESLRNYLLDREDLNQLNLNELELKDPDLEEAVKDGAMAYDLIPPLSTTGLGGISVDSKEWYLIKRWSAIEAMQRLVFLHVRNRNPVNDQGFQVDEFGKASEWKTIKGELVFDIRAQTERYKRLLDLQAFGGSTVSLDSTIS